MNMPERNVALMWVGRTVVDRDGAEIGACTAVFADDATEQAEWVCSEFDGGTVFIPAVGAAESDGMVQVVISREDVAGAPSVGGPEHISGDEEVALYRHYGIPHSRDASPTVLPTEDAVPPAADSAAAFDSTAAFDSAAVSDSATVSESVGTPDFAAVSESVGTPDFAAVSESATTPATTGHEAPTPVRDDGEAATSRSGSKAKSRVMAAVGGVTALAVAAGAVLRRRQRQQQQQSLTARIGTTTQLVRQRKAGAVAASSALAAAAIAARRRRSRDPLSD